MPEALARLPAVITDVSVTPPPFQTATLSDVGCRNPDGGRHRLRPGMLVTADIIGGKRTVLDYILSPIKRATDAAFREK